MTDEEIEDALPKKVELVIEGKKYVYVRKDVAEELRKRIKAKIRKEMNFITELWEEGKIDETTMKEIKCGLGQIGYMI